MGIQYKPTKQKKEKPVKAPKAPKADKLMKMGGAVKVKASKPAKVPKQPKAPKPEKAITFKPGKVEKAEKFEGVGKLKKPVNTKILAAVLGSIAVVVVAVVLIFVLPDDEIVIEPQSLIVETLPDKTTYYVGEIAVFNGLKLKMTLTNGVAIAVDGSECEITGFDSSEPAENQIITVKYKNLQTTFMITIQKLPEVITGKFNGLSIKTMPKTNYKVGDYLSVEGGVLLLHYDDGSTREIPLDYNHISGFKSSQPGTYELKVKYVEHGFLATCTYTITVTE